MTNSKLLDEFEQEFDKMKKELGFKSSFQDLEKIFFLKDFIQNEGYVSTNLSRMICHRISKTFNSWTSYLHGLVIPNPNSMMSVKESKIFEDEEKQKIINLLNDIMELVSRNTLIGLTKDKKLEAQFIDDAVDLWNNKLDPKFVKIVKKVNTSWKEKASK
ncbi:MAG: hypothetical protein MAG795_00723 [Candidatus Woesearchaeota archaeon]|nr:hypothetical protein [Candidatus Woesearchaeota archaeon]